jgi:transposase
MIHKIKAMWDEGRGSSQRAIAEELKISRNTVKKYLEMSAEEIAAYQERKGRSKRLDLHRAYIERVVPASVRDRLTVR